MKKSILKEVRYSNNQAITFNQYLASNNVNKEVKSNIDNAYNSFNKLPAREIKDNSARDAYNKFLIAFEQ